MTPFFQRLFGATLGSLAAGWSDGPWRSKSVITAVVVVVLGMGFWTNRALKENRAKPADTTVVESTNAAPDTAAKGFDRPMPGYVRLCASYIGGFCIGWVFRRFVKLAALALVLAVSLLGIGKFTGCDTAGFRARMERTAVVAKEKAGQERDFLRSLLPSATAGGIGAFFGLRRRGRDLAPAPPAEPPA